MDEGVVSGGGHELAVWREGRGVDLADVFLEVEKDFRVGH